MTMTSTTSPLCSSTYCSVFGGNIRRPLALRMLISRLLIWFPEKQRRNVVLTRHLAENVYTKQFMQYCTASPRALLKATTIIHSDAVPHYPFSTNGVPSARAKADVPSSPFSNASIERWFRAGTICSA